MSTTYEDTNRPNVIIDEPHPGTFVIRGHNPNTIDADEGRIVPLPECYVAPEVPTSALLFILEKRGFEFADDGSNPVANAVGGSTAPSSLVSGLTPEEIESLVIEALAKNDGTMRIGPLAQEILIPDEEIKSASKFEPCRFEIVSGGWVKLKKTEGAE